ncbi:MAG: ATP synthase F1 subunit epsilon [Lachnospiraceae bacterium]|nr:ATP synthase F1 subunit epsilon [Lachnospiraceae bacterium]
MSTENKEYMLRIVTPERVFYEGSVDMVEMNTSEGQIGVLPGHIPLTVIVKPGILVITQADGERKEAALHAGFAEILPDGMTILAEIIEWPDEIDENRAEAALRRAKERIANRENQTDLARAETALQRAMARIEVLKK